MSEPDSGAFGLDGSVCAVTGAGSGIGRAIALALAAEGARLAVVDRNRDGAAETAALVEQAGAEVASFGCDVSDPALIAATHTEIAARFGAVDVLVNNAGIIRPGALDTLSLEDWNALIAVNLTGYFLCSQAFGKPMLARGKGTLVHTSSVAGECATPFSGSYSVAKAGVTMLSRLLALEWGPRGVRSNAVLPGMIVTPMVKAVWEAPGAMEARSALVPSRRPGYPEDIAQAVLFLASPRSDYVNGTELIVDGGLTKNVMGLVPRHGFEAPKT